MVLGTEEPSTNVSYNSQGQVLWFIFSSGSQEVQSQQESFLHGWCYYRRKKEHAAIKPSTLQIGVLPRMYTTVHGGVGRKILEVLFVLFMFYNYTVSVQKNIYVCIYVYAHEMHAQKGFINDRYKTTAANGHQVLFPLTMKPTVGNADRDDRNAAQELSVVCVQRENDTTAQC